MGSVDIRVQSSTSDNDDRPTAAPAVLAGSSAVQQLSSNDLIESPSQSADLVLTSGTTVSSSCDVEPQAPGGRDEAITGEMVDKFGTPEDQTGRTAASFVRDVEPQVPGGTDEAITGEMVEPQAPGGGDEAITGEMVEPQAPGGRDEAIGGEMVDKVGAPEDQTGRTAASSVRDVELQTPGDVAETLPEEMESESHQNVAVASEVQIGSETVASPSGRVEPQASPGETESKSTTERVLAVADDEASSGILGGDKIICSEMLSRPLVDHVGKVAPDHEELPGESSTLHDQHDLSELKDEDDTCGDLHGLPEDEVTKNTDLHGSPEHEELEEHEDDTSGDLHGLPEDDVTKNAEVENVLVQTVSGGHGLSSVEADGFQTSSSDSASPVLDSRCGDLGGDLSVLPEDEVSKNTEAVENVMERSEGGRLSSVEEDVQTHSSGVDDTQLATSGGDMKVSVHNIEDELTTKVTEPESTMVESEKLADSLPSDDAGKFLPDVCDVVGGGDRVHVVDTSSGSVDTDATIQSSHHGTDRCEAKHADIDIPATEPDNRPSLSIHSGAVTTTQSEQHEAGVPVSNETGLADVARASCISVDERRAIGETVPGETDSESFEKVGARPEGLTGETGASSNDDVTAACSEVTDEVVQPAYDETLPPDTVVVQADDLLSVSASIDARTIAPSELSDYHVPPGCDVGSEELDTVAVVRADKQPSVCVDGSHDVDSNVVQEPLVAGEERPTAEEPVRDDDVCDVTDGWLDAVVNVSDVSFVVKDEQPTAELCVHTGDETQTATDTETVAETVAEQAGAGVAVEERSFETVASADSGTAKTKDATAETVARVDETSFETVAAVDSGTDPGKETSDETVAGVDETSFETVAAVDETTTETVAAVDAVTGKNAILSADNDDGVTEDSTSDTVDSAYSRLYAKNVVKPNAPATGSTAAALLATRDTAGTKPPDTGKAGTTTRDTSKAGTQPVKVTTDEASPSEPVVVMRRKTNADPDPADGKEDHDKTKPQVVRTQTYCLLPYAHQWLNGLVVSALAIRARGPGFDSRVAPLFHWLATLGKLFTHIASPVSQLQETGVQNGVFGA